MGVRPRISLFHQNEILFPNQARKNHLNYFGSVIADITQYVEKMDALTGEKTIKLIGQKLILDV